MENGAISDSQITASSQWDKNHAASRARLNIKMSGNMKGGWSARLLNLKQWIQVDLGRYTTVTRVATQGRNGLDQWVTKYRLLYSNHGVNFHSYKELGDTSAKVCFLNINPLPRETTYHFTTPLLQFQGHPRERELLSKIPEMSFSFFSDCVRAF